MFNYFLENNLVKQSSKEASQLRLAPLKLEVKN